MTDSVESGIIPGNTGIRQAPRSQVREKHGPRREGTLDVALHKRRVVPGLLVGTQYTGRRHSMAVG